MNQPGFVHLHVHSAYSLAEGAIKIENLVKLCRQHKMPAVAVTDTNNLFGAMEFATSAADEGIQPIIGAQVKINEAGDQIVLLAQSEAGYRNLCKLVSDAYMAGGEAGFSHIDLAEFEKHAEGLICLTGGSKGPVAQAIVHHQKERAEEVLLLLEKYFKDRLYIELQRHGMPDEAASEEGLIDLAYKHDIPLVATNDCYFTAPQNYDAHDALLCIAEGRYITEDDRRKVTKQHYFKSAKEMTALFEDVPEAIANTVVIAQRCAFLLEPIQPILPPFKTEKGRSEIEEITAQAEEGLEWRLENFVFTPEMGKKEKVEAAKPYRERMKYELGVITQMGFSGYFLIVSDFIRWAKDHDIPVGPGRGSGAGSVVAWAMKITDLDPLKLNLLFERFLNPERVSMPDFDIDFCQERRDEVIKYVQDRYGKDHVAQIITFGKLQARAVVRDVGRVLQMPYGMVDRIAKMIPNNPANPITLEEAILQDAELRAERERDDTHKKLIDVALQLEGLYRHASTHAAGVVIGDRPLHELIPLYRDPRSEMAVTQFNMKYIEQAGLIKFDFLGLKTMTVIQKTVELIERSKKEKIDILKIPFDDEKTFKMLARGENTGVFQMESAGMRDLGKQMKISNFEQIIALVALYRPGPMENIPTYLACLHGRQERDYMHEKLRPFLEETYGIMIYQEQVMQAAQVLSGYSLGSADLLRRAMGKKIKEEMDAQRDQFVKGAKEHSNVPAGQANAIFDQIAKFAGYGFNKAHSAGYALIAYWTAWLKANYPVEFMAASMTLDMGNTDKLSVFKQDLDRMKIPLLPPDVNKSWPDFAVQDGAIRYALAALKGVGAAAMSFVVEERKKNGPYKSIEDFATRLDPRTMNKRQLEQLAAAGAFECLDPSRTRVHDGAELIMRYAQSQKEERESGQVNLFGGGADKGLGMPALPKVKDWDPLEKLSMEFGAVGFYLSAHPLDTRQAQLKRIGIAMIADVQAELQNRSGGTYQMAGVLLKKQEKMSQKGSKYAFLQLSDPTGIYEVTLFSELLHQSRDILVAGEALLLTVGAEMREDQMRFTANRIEKLESALEGKIREIHVHLTDAAPAAKLKQFMDVEGRGASQIGLFVTLEDGRVVTMDIPGRWALSAQARNVLRGETGVLSVSEG